jgi:hypothetical protein
MSRLIIESAYGTFLNMLDHIPEWYARVRNPTKGVDLPEQHAKAPHVRLVRKLGMSQCLKLCRIAVKI